MIRSLPASPTPVVPLSPFVSVKTLDRSIHQSYDSVQWYHKHSFTVWRQTARRVRLLVTVWMITQSYQKPRSWRHGAAWRTQCTIQPQRLSLVLNDSTDYYNHSVKIKKGLVCMRWTGKWRLFPCCLQNFLPTKTLACVKNMITYQFSIHCNPSIETYNKNIWTNTMLTCKYILVIHNCVWIFICASQHLCLHLHIFVSHLCSLCYWTKASGNGSDKWCLAQIWTVH